MQLTPEPQDDLPLLPVVPEEQTAAIQAGRALAPPASSVVVVVVVVAIQQHRHGKHSIITQADSLSEAPCMEHDSCTVVRQRE